MRQLAEYMHMHTRTHTHTSRSVVCVFIRVRGYENTYKNLMKLVVLLGRGGGWGFYFFMCYFGEEEEVDWSWRVSVTLGRPMNIRLQAVGALGKLTKLTVCL